MITCKYNDIIQIINDISFVLLTVFTFNSFYYRLKINPGQIINLIALADGPDHPPPELFDHLRLELIP